MLLDAWHNSELLMTLESVLIKVVYGLCVHMYRMVCMHVGSVLCVCICCGVYALLAGQMSLVLLFLLEWTGTDPLCYCCGDC